jgi:hypothetical protein
VLALGLPSAVGLEPGGQPGEGRRGLQTREPGAGAEVRAQAEGEIAGGAAGKVEPTGT